MSFGRINAKRNAEQVLIQMTRELTLRSTTNPARAKEVRAATDDVLAAKLTAAQIMLVAELVNKINLGHDHHTKNLETRVRELTRLPRS